MNPTKRARRGSRKRDSEPPGCSGTAGDVIRPTSHGRSPSAREGAGPGPGWEMPRIGENNARYRTKIEVLRDIVRAATNEERKTRIIGMANLNQVSFQRYSSLGVSLGLLQPTGSGLSATPAAEEWLGAVDTIISKSSEVAAAIDTLYRLTPPIRNGGNGSARGKPPYDAVQLLARLAWADLRPSAQAISAGRTPPTRHTAPRDAFPPMKRPSGRGR